ncbi:MAG: hypothetical protein R6X12_06635 [bacterium]
MRWQNRDISDLAGIAALVLVALLLLGLFWLVCAAVFFGREHHAPRL